RPGCPNYLPANREDGTMQKMILTAGPSITQKEIEYVLDAVRYGWNENWNLYLRRFEAAFAAYVGTRFALAPSSLTGGLHPALAGLGRGAGRRGDRPGDRLGRHRQRRDVLRRDAGLRGRRSRDLVPGRRLRRPGRHAANPRPLARPPLRPPRQHGGRQP